jgi:hypothetical protein
LLEDIANANVCACIVLCTGAKLYLTEYVFDKGFWGLAVKSNGDFTTMQYTNEKHEIMENITSPWFEDINYGSEIVIENVK